MIFSRIRRRLREKREKFGKNRSFVGVIEGFKSSRCERGIGLWRSVFPPLRSAADRACPRPTVPPAAACCRWFQRAACHGQPWDRIHRAMPTGSVLTQLVPAISRPGLTSWVCRRPRTFAARIVWIPSMMPRCTGRAATRSATTRGTR